VTYASSPERNHIETLKDLGFYYTNPYDLLNLLVCLEKDVSGKDWNAYKHHTPQIGIQKFKEILLD